MDALAKKPFHKVGRFGHTTIDPITVRDIHLDILYVLFIHHMAPTNIIRELLPAKVTQRVVGNKCRAMKHTPNKLIHQPPMQARADRARCSFLIYTLSDKGARTLVEHGRISYLDYLLWKKVRAQYRSQHFDHTLATAYATASMEIACRQLGYTYLSWHALLTRPNCPKETLLDDNPIGIPYEINGTTHYCTPDQFYGVEFGNGAIFFMRETDMSSEQHEEREKGGSSTKQKARAWREILRSGACFKRFGIKDPYVLFETVSIIRMHNIIDAIVSVASKDGKGSARNFVFKANPLLAVYYGQELPADGRELTEPFTSIARKPLDLSKE